MRLAHKASVRRNWQSRYEDSCPGAWGQADPEAAVTIQDRMIDEAETCRNLGITQGYKPNPQNRKQIDIHGHPCEY